jgi:plasmid stabilization system protein ParE
MSLAIQKAPAFIRDFEGQFEWYVREANWAVADGYLSAVEETLSLLAEFSGMGRLRRFRHPALKGIRSFRINPPFNRHLIFYRNDAGALYAVRLMHGARDLARRLVEAPGNRER